MNKRMIFRTLAALLALLCALAPLCACKQEPTLQPPAEPQSPSADGSFVPILRFAVASDIHFIDYETIRDEKLEKMFADVYAYCDAHANYRELDGVFFAGDLTDRGTPASLKRFFAALETHAGNNTATRACMGNHEFYNDAANTNANFLAASGYTSVDSHLNLNGYHFILISPDKNGNGFTDPKKEWLATQLAIAAQDDPTGKKPIFVFQHHHVSDTVYGSANTWGITDLTSVLARYPQVVDFSGHSHFPINDPRSIWQGTFTAFNTASLKGLEMDIVGVAEEKIFPSDAEGGWSDTTATRNDGGQYYVVEVDAHNRVLVQAFDIVSGTSVIEPILLEVGDTTKFTYTNDRAKTEAKPSFAANAKAEAISMTTTFARFRFPRTAGNTYVQHYRCELYCGGEMIRTIYRLDCGFLFPAPDSLTLPLSDLTANTAYEVKIIPVTAWGNEGDPLAISFTTRESDDAASTTVFSAVFEKDNVAKDTVSNTVLQASGTPTTVFDDTLGAYIAVFDGNSAFEFHRFSTYHEQLANAVTFEAYLRMDAVPQNDYVNPLSNQQGGGYGFEYKSNKDMHFYINVGGKYYSVKAPLESGEWAHLVGTYDGDTLRLYVNGAPADSRKIGGPIKPPAATFLAIGADSETDSCGKYAVCAISTANVYAKALTEEEIKELYRAYTQDR